MTDQHTEDEPHRIRAIGDTDILSSIPPAIMYISKIPDTETHKDGFVPSFVSDNIREILGFTPAEILGNARWWQEHVHPDDKPHVLSHLTRVRERGKSNHEYRLRHRDGHYLWVQDEVALVQDGREHPEQLIGAWRNVTRRKQAAEAFRELQFRCQDIFENMADVYYKTDMDGRLRLISPSCRMHTGYAEEEIIGRRVTDFYAEPSQREELLKALQEHGRVNDFELGLLHKDGSLRYASATSHLVYDQHYRPIGVEGILRNITDRRQGEERLSALLRENRDLMLQLMHVQEEERRILARELHDELGQLLTGIGARAEVISRQADEPTIMSAAGEIARDTEALFRLSRSILRRLRPATLDTLGLAAALEELVDDWSRQTGTACTLHIDEDIDHLDDHYNISIYRLVQEGLTNAYRHGKATQMDVTIQNLSQTETRLHLLQIDIEDNGKGIRVKNVADGMGMIGMRERVHALGGSFLIADLPFDGVRITAKIPLTPAGD